MSVFLEEPEDKRLENALEIIRLSTEQSADREFKLDISNLSIPTAAITAVIGANGCGKSTMLEAVLEPLP